MASYSAAFTLYFSVSSSGSVHVCEPTALVMSIVSTAHIHTRSGLHGNRAQDIMVRATAV